MLGIKAHRNPVQGPKANEIRHAAARAVSGRLSHEDMENVRRSKQAMSRFDITWEK